jgi:hypothetical protein
VLRDRRYLAVGRARRSYAWTTLRRPDGGLFRTARRGRAHLDACLEDYAFVATPRDALRAGGPLAWLEPGARARERIGARLFGRRRRLLRHGDGPRKARRRARARVHDGALPNANAVAPRALVQARRVTSIDRDLAERALAPRSTPSARWSTAPARLRPALVASTSASSRRSSSSSPGAPARADREALEVALAARYLPRRVVWSRSNRTVLPTTGLPVARGEARRSAGEGLRLYVLQDTYALRSARHGTLSKSLEVLTLVAWPLGSRFRRLARAISLVAASVRERNLWKRGALRTRMNAPRGCPKLRSRSRSCASKQLLGWSLRQSSSRLTPSRPRARMRELEPLRFELELETVQSPNQPFRHARFAGAFVRGARGGRPALSCWRSPSNPTARRTASPGKGGCERGRVTQPKTLTPRFCLPFRRSPGGRFGPSILRTLDELPPERKE